VLFTLLSYCTGFCQFAYALRTTPTTEELFALCKRLDDACLRIFDKHFGPVPKRAMEQVVRPQRLGGLGIRRCERHASAAYVASVMAAAAFDGWNPEDGQHFLAALTSVASLAAMSMDDIKAMKKQHDISSAIEKRFFTQDLASLPPSDLQRVTSQSAEYASAWLSAIPSHDTGMSFTPKQFTTLVSFWLGAPVYDQERVCPFCGAHMDVYGEHAMRCMKSGARIWRHHSLCDEVFRAMRHAHLQPQREKVIGPGTRPGDVFAPHFNLGRPMAMDLAVTNTLQPNNSTHAGELVAPGTWAQRYAALHKARAADICAAQGVDFVPLVVESYGAWDPDAISVLRDIASRQAAHTHESTCSTMTWLMRRLSVTLQRVNARIILMRSAYAATPDDDIRAFDDEALEARMLEELVEGVEEEEEELR